MSDQFQEQAAFYEKVMDLPDYPMEYHRLRKAVGNLEGLSVLDLACGIGNSTRNLLSWGAARVVGVDISAAMLSQTKAMTEDLRVSFHQADCGGDVPVRIPGGPFDLVHAAWLLDYAADQQQMSAMWRTIAVNLKPRGRFVGIVPNPDFDFDDPSWKQYGASFERSEKVADGWKIVATAYTDPPVRADAYLLRAEVYARAAAAAGMTGFCFDPVDVPVEVPQSGTDYWADYLRNPRTAICRAQKKGKRRSWRRRVDDCLSAWFHKAIGAGRCYVGA